MGVNGRMGGGRAATSRHAPVAEAMDYMPTRWGRFTCFLEYDRAGLRCVRPIAGAFNPERRSA